MSDICRRSGDRTAEADGPGAAGTLVAALVRTGGRQDQLDGAAITAMGSDQLREVLWASDPVIAEVEGLQFSRGEGPSLEAHDSRQPVLIDDVTEVESSRWPALVPELLALPVGALFTFPLAIGAVTIGILSVYRRTSGALSPTARSMVSDLADAATQLVISAGDPGNDGTWWDGPGNNRLVHQATGILMVQLRLPVEQAFARLRAYSLAHSRQISEVADDIVHHRLRIDPQRALG